MAQIKIGDDLIDVADLNAQQKEILDRLQLLDRMLEEHQILMQSLSLLKNAIEVELEKKLLNKTAGGILE